jgi:hypothetical protein
MAPARSALLTRALPPVVGLGLCWISRIKEVGDLYRDLDLAMTPSHSLNNSKGGFLATLKERRIPAERA